jgi:hypothetical protein
LQVATMSAAASAIYNSTLAILNVSHLYRDFDVCYTELSVSKLLEIQSKMYISIFRFYYGESCAQKNSGFVLYVPLKCEKCWILRLVDAIKINTFRSYFIYRVFQSMWKTEGTCNRLTGELFLEIKSPMIFRVPTDCHSVLCT